MRCLGFIRAVSTPAIGLAIALSPTLGSAAGLPTLLGKLEYRSSCASCHGAEGLGDGPVADQLKTQPVNLQMIAKNNDGEFPAGQLYEIIDGRQMVRAHGDSDMPIWGSVYSSKIKGIGGGGESGPRSLDVEAAVNGKILSLVYFIESIQAK